MFDNGNDMFYEERAGVTERDVALYLAKVMGWMCVGLLTTFVSAIFCLAVPSVFTLFYSSNMIYAVFFVQLIVVVAMSGAINKIGAGTATVLFMVYAALTGVTFTSLFILFELVSLLTVFCLTSFLFVLMAVYGFATKKDLTRVGSLAFFGLIGIILAGILNFFLRSSLLDFAVTCIGIVIFIVLIAYDTQKIKAFYIGATGAGYDEASPVLHKAAIYGALTLYLDFINLFLKLLRLMGRRRN